MSAGGTGATFQLASIGPALAGGMLIGAAVALLLIANGRVAGISGIVGGAVSPGAEPGERGWRVLFVLGLLVGAAIARVAFPGALGSMTASVPVLAAAGLLVGFGTRLSNGCTSGHGVCGNSRLSPRSLVATLTFMGVAGVVVYLLAHLRLGAT